MATVHTEALSESLGLRDCKPIPFEQLPFSALDPLPASEDELQAVVVADATTCDLPLSIRESRFFRNIARRSASGEAPRRTLLELEAFLHDTHGVWENSWIRFPESRLSRHALHVFHAIFRSRGTAPPARARTRCAFASRRTASPGCGSRLAMR